MKTEMTHAISIDLGEARKYFDETQKRVVDATTGLSPAQWTFKAAPDRWSIQEILEHMVLSQERILGPVREQWAQAPPPEPGRDYRQIDAIVLEKLPDRSRKVKGPDFMEPRGEGTPAEALQRFFRNYERLAAFVESTPDLREHVLESKPLSFVTNGAHTLMDGYQWALTMAAHDQRHLFQMLEVKADPGYPRAVAGVA